MQNLDDFFEFEDDDILENFVDEPDDINEPDEPIEPDSSEGNEPDAPPVVEEVFFGEDPNDEKEPDLLKYFDQLKDLEVLRLEDDFEFDGSKEKLEEAIQSTIDNYKKEAFEALKETFDEETLRFLNYKKATQNSGTAADFYENYYLDIPLEDLDLSNAEDQVYVVKKFLEQSTSLSPDKITRQVQRLAADPSALRDEAFEALESLEKIQEDRILENDRQIQEKIKKDEESFKKYQSDISTVIKDSALPKERQSRVKDFTLTIRKEGDKYTTKLNETLHKILTTPSQLVQLADMLLEYDEKTGLSFDKYTKQGQSKAVSDVQEKLLKAASSTGVTSKSAKVSSKKVDWEELFNSL